MKTPKQDELDKLLDNIQVGTGLSGWRAHAKQAIATHIKQEVIEARKDEIDIAIKMTQQMWHTKSPFTNIENINANTLASTAQYLLTRQATLAKSIGESHE